MKQISLELMRRRKLMDLFLHHLTFIINLSLLKTVQIPSAATCLVIMERSRITLI